MSKDKGKSLLLLHMLLMVYSTSGIFSKLAAKECFLSPLFCIYYSVILILLGIYAAGWQQIIKRLPLTTAFANKAVTVAWGMIWGRLLFHEQITVGKASGAGLVILGIILYAKGDEAA